MEPEAVPGACRTADEQADGLPLRRGRSTVMNDGESWATDTWCRYLPALHRTLADPAVDHGLPRSYARLDFEQTCAWWETLRYLFRNLLGWRCLPAGLAWWYETGKPDLDDARLRLVRERWDTEGELDFFAAREWE